tara:strand:- start:1783 stop:2082 length:300 start_codon:yes stop_codon:yes gene_type:complete
MRDVIQNIINESIDEINDFLPQDSQITKDDDQLLYGTNGVLDSMGIINFCLLVEEKFAEVFSKEISLIDDSAFSEEMLPIESVRNLKAYLTKLKSLNES